MIWLFIAFAVFLWWHGKKSSLARGASATRGTTPHHRANGAEDMTQCAHCGMYIPLSEAVNSNKGHVFCTEEHLRLNKSFHKSP